MATLLLLINIYLPLIRGVEYVNGDITSPFTLYNGDTMESYNSLSRLAMQSDGNLVTHSRVTTSETWVHVGFASGTVLTGDHVTLQNDGELVVFNTQEEVQWTSHSISGTAPFRLIVSDDIALYILDSSNDVIWSTNPSFSDLQTVWSETFDSNNGNSWQYGNNVELPSTSVNCPNSPDNCVMIDGTDSFVIRSTVISMYNAIQFQVDVSAKTGDYCDINWAFDGDEWIRYDTRYQNDVYRDVIIDIPLPTSYTFINISLDATGTDIMDECYFDNAILRARAFTPFDEVESFYCELSANSKAGTPNNVDIYLWFNFTIYKYTMSAPQVGDAFTATKSSNPPLQVYGSSNCHKTENNNDVPDAKMMVINDHSDAVFIERVQLTLKSGDWFGMDTFYHEGTIYPEICVNNIPTGTCYPPKQINYFDLTKEGQYIEGALWEDGTNIDIQIITCDPTEHPTSSPTSPTPSPSSFPTQSPTQLPSSTPSPMSSTSSPTSPTPSSSSFPTPSPTPIPSSTPSTSSPTKFPFAESTEITTPNPPLYTLIPSYFQHSISPSAVIYSTHHVSAENGAINTRNNSLQLAVAGLAISICIVCCCIIVLSSMLYYQRKANTASHSQSKCYLEQREVEVSRAQSHVPPPVVHVPLEIQRIDGNNQGVTMDKELIAKEPADVSTNRVSAVQFISDEGENDDIKEEPQSEGETKSEDDNVVEDMQVTRDAMINDKIVSGTISTKKLSVILRKQKNDSDGAMDKELLRKQTPQMQLIHQKSNEGESDSDSEALYEYDGNDNEQKKNDKIALAVGDHNIETRTSNDSNDVVGITRSAMINDKIVRGIVSTRKQSDDSDIAQNVNEDKITALGN